MKKAAGSFLYLVLSAGFLYLLHTALFRSLPDVAQDDFHYTLPELYSFFTGSAIVVMATVLIVERRNRDIVGLSFLLVSTVKMIAAGWFARPLLAVAGIGMAEKMNFLSLFILFLAIETVLTIRILNKKQ